jgi:hypothetical protein
MLSLVGLPRLHPRQQAHVDPEDAADGGRTAALGAQPEVNRPPRPIHGTIDSIIRLEFFTYVSSTLHDRPTAWANRFQRFSNSGAYRHTPTS